MARNGNSYASSSRNLRPPYVIGRAFLLGSMRTLVPSEAANLPCVSKYRNRPKNWMAPSTESFTLPSWPSPYELARASATVVMATFNPSASMRCRSASAWAFKMVVVFCASAAATAAAALPSASLIRVIRSPSDLRMAALFFRSAAICNSIAASMSVLGSMFCSSTRVISTPHVLATPLRSLSSSLLIRSRDEKDSSSVSLPTSSRSCVRHRFIMAFRTSSTW
mmetsp:Transcript_11636/g.27479  ORF Transcript_11636/g.27479 Transcript_11636/m.27479 type:complete len:223 (+) Transcript_11636:226-894(+)